MKVEVPASGFVIALFLLFPGIASAQTWTAELSAGQAVHDAVAATPEVSSTNGMVSLRFSGLQRQFVYLSLGLPVQDGASSWGALGGGTRWIARGDRYGFGDGVSLGARLAAHGYGFRDPTTTNVGSGGTLELLPLVELRQGRGRIEFHSGLVATRSGYQNVSSSRSLLDAGARAFVTAVPTVQLGANLRYLHAEEGGYPYVGVSGWSGNGPLEGWAYAGRWMDDGLEEQMAWGIGASLRIGRTFELRSSVNREPDNPIYWNAPRTSWKVGIAHRFGGSPVVPISANARPPEVENGGVTIRIPLGGLSEPPSIAGDFTGWTAVPMRREGSQWTARFQLSPGVYHFAFRSADGKWFVPSTLPHRVSDGFGGESAVLIVP
jgi:hypothetical protein